jgi:hypothetical protein
MSLWHLVYLSNAPTDEVGEDELQSILATAVKNNKATDITGMLLYSDGGFIQVLEGEHDAVEATFQKIRMDPRHRNIIVLANGKIAARAFPEWSMGYRRIGSKELARAGEYAAYFDNGFNTARITAQPGVAMTLLKSFGQVHRLK